jgi:lipoprotein-releasing system permease protein
MEGFVLYELFIAIRHLTSRRRQTVLSVMGIGLAVMILMVSQASIVGLNHVLYTSIVDKIPHVIVKPGPDEDHIYLYNSFVEDIKNIDGVIGVSPVLFGQATFEYKSHSRNVIMQGIHVVDHDSVLGINEYITHGSFRDLEMSHNSVVLGDALAGKLDVKIDDLIDASFPEAHHATLKVVGIYDSGTPQDENLAFTSLSTARDFFDVSSVVNSILIRVDDPDTAQLVSDSINNPGVVASSWMETNPEILQLSKLKSIGNKILLGLIIIIASFSMVSTLFMMVMGKTKEIGMLMAMGASRRSISVIFLLESGIMGFIGPVLGVAVGILICLQIGSITMDMGEGSFGGESTFPFIVRIQDAVVIVIFTFILNLLGGIIPARRASTLDPVEALGSE